MSDGKLSSDRLYVVCWQMDIHADSAREAAEKARKYQLDPDTTACVFDVYHGEEMQTIDLLEEGKPDDHTERN